MARINVDDELHSDPRFEQLCSLSSKVVAYGSLICFWRVGQSYWKKNELPIPKEIAEMLPGYSEIKKAGFAVEKDGGVYCVGACERWGFLTSRQEAGRIGGLASVEARKSKLGTAIPINATNSSSEANARSKPKQMLEANRSKPKPSSSSSSSEIHKYKNTGAELRKSQSSPIKPSSVDDLLGILGQEYLAEISMAYPDPDYLQRETRKLFLWFKDQPRKSLKTPAGWRRTVTSWMNRGWDNHTNRKPKESAQRVFSV